MVSSGLLLAIFIGRWLQTEYTSAKNDLSKTIFEEFIDANRKVTDSLIANKLIYPILNDTNGFKINTIARRDVSETGDSIQIITTTAFGDSMPANIDIKGIHENINQENFKLEFTTDSNDLLYQGVKLFITEMKGKRGEHGFFRDMMEAKDTLLLQTLFAANLDSSKIDVSPVWVSGREEQLFPPPPFYYPSNLLNKPYGVEIRNYNTYLIRGMIPEFIFSFLLLSIITLAFIFSYRNMRNQMRLATMKDDLISNISHELKTPVATVKVAIEAMQQMDPALSRDRFTNYLGMAEQEISRLDLLVSKIMNGILLENGKQVFQEETINPVIIIEEAIGGMQVLSQQQQGSLAFNNHAYQGFIIGDSLHIKGVLFNLIENALKYGGPNPQVSVDLAHTATNTIITVSDKGYGIPEEYLNKVFDKFFRVPDGNKHNIKGYGLGLNYAAAVMAASNGKISVKNNETGGCTFTLTFPNYEQN